MKSLIPFKATPMEAEALEWAVSGHNNAVEDPDYHADNPEDAAITEGTNPETWPVPDIEDVLYRLEQQAPHMGPDWECEAFGRTCKRIARKLRACRADGDQLDTGFSAPR